MIFVLLLPVFRHYSSLHQLVIEALSEGGRSLASTLAVEPPAGLEPATC